MKVDNTRKRRSDSQALQITKGFVSFCLLVPLLLLGYYFQLAKAAEDEFTAEARCQFNLRQIHIMKKLYAKKRGLLVSANRTHALELGELFAAVGSALPYPICPLGGSYTIGSLSDPQVVCSYSNQTRRLAWSRQGLRFETNIHLHRLFDHPFDESSKE